MVVQGRDCKNVGLALRLDAKEKNIARSQDRVHKSRKVWGGVAASKEKKSSRTAFYMVIPDDNSEKKCIEGV